MGEPLLADDGDKARAEVHNWALEKIKRLEAQLQTQAEALNKKFEVLSMPDASLVSGEERWYSVSEAATFFNRTPAWMYERLTNEKFTYRDGTPIKPVLVGTGKRPRRRFNLDLLLAIARSMYRDGTVKMEEMKLIKRRIAQGEFEEVLFDPDLEDE